MKRAVQDLVPFIHLMTSTGGRQMAAGGLLAVAAALSGMALLGLSGWFITATAIAGLSVATAVIFDVFAPSAGIRFLALSRTAARYGERLATHDATFRVLAALREHLFRRWAERPVARQLMLRPSKLLFRLTQDVDALESIYLRLVVPVAVAGCAALAMSVALSLMHPLFGAAAGLFLLVAGLGVPLIAVSAAARVSHRRVRSVEKLRARTIDLVSGQTDLIMAGRLAAQRDAIVRADRRIADADMSLSRTESWLVIGFGTIGAMLLSCVLLAASVLVERGTVGPPVAALAVLIALGAMEPFAALRRSVFAFGGMLLAARRIRARQTAGNAEPACEKPRASFAVACSGVG